MTYFKVGNSDFSKYVAGLAVNYTRNYNALTNAKGNTTIDFINQKRNIVVRFIPLLAADCKTILSTIGDYCTISFLDPKTNNLKSALVIVEDNETNYYTIQDGKVMLQEMEITFTEL